MMIRSSLYYLLAILILFTFAQCEIKSEPQIVNLWAENMPLDNGITEPEELLGNGYLATNVSVPQLYIFQPKKNNTGKAVVICPGGGYAALGIGHEGTLFAEWLSSIGITGIVLKYRLPNGNKEIPLLDVQQAIRYVRQNAATLGVDVDKVGIAGFSAGGHIASLSCTKFATEGVDTRPNFSIFYYPVITMQNGITHNDTRRQLLGDSLVQADVDFYSNELHVSENTPPAILFLSDDDDQVNPMNSILYYDALKEKNIPAAMYVFPRGEHGWGMSPQHMKFTYYKEMLILLERWLNDLN